MLKINIFWFERDFEASSGERTTTDVLHLRIVQWEVDIVCNVDVLCSKIILFDICMFYLYDYKVSFIVLLSFEIV